MAVYKGHGHGRSQNKRRALLGQAFEYKVLGVGGEGESLAFLPVQKHAAPVEYNKELRSRLKNDQRSRRFSKRNVPHALWLCCKACTSGWPANLIATIQEPSTAACQGMYRTYEAISPKKGYIGRYTLASHAPVPSPLEVCPCLIRPQEQRVRSKRRAVVRVRHTAGPVLLSPAVGIGLGPHSRSPLRAALTRLQCALSGHLADFRKLSECV